MQPTEFERMVFDSLLRDDPDEGLLRVQLDSVVVTKRDHTGHGLYSHLQVPPDVARVGSDRRYVQDVPKTHLLHPQLEAGAGAMLWLKDGVAVTLECYTFGGDWPGDESLFRVG
ncbi:MAG TPA: hypothetical protein VF454_05805 [Gemmatimonadales bacterium]